MSRYDLSQRVAEAGERALKVGQFGLAARHTVQRSFEAVHDSAQARVLGERTEERLCGDHLLGRRFHLIIREEEQAVAVEERAAVRPAHQRKKLLLTVKGVGERSGSGFGEFRRRTVDDDQN